MSRQHEHDRTHRRMLRRRAKAEQRTASLHGEAPSLLDELDAAAPSEALAPVADILDLARLLPRPLAWVLGLFTSYGLLGMWTAAVTYACCAALVMSVKFRGGTWKTIKL